MDFKEVWPMAEIQEVFEDFAENTKKAIKSKPFLFAAVGVGLIALYVGWKRNRDAADDSGPYEAIGYAGYPTVGGSGGEYVDDSAYYESLLDEYQTSISDMQTEHNSAIADLTQQYDTSLDELQSNIRDLSEKHKSTEEALSEQTYQLERERALSQMKANSELYNALSKEENAEEREALHAENLAIAEKYGWTYDPRSGNYFDGSSVVYTTSAQQAARYGSGSVSTTKKASPGSVSYENNASYANRVANSVQKASSGNANRVAKSVQNAAKSVAGSTPKKASSGSASHANRVANSVQKGASSFAAAVKVSRKTK